MTGGLGEILGDPPARLGEEEAPRGDEAANRLGTPEG